MQTILSRSPCSSSAAATDVLAASLTGSGRPVTETRTVSGFTGFGFSSPASSSSPRATREPA
jgi:hypothetical protein